MKTFVVRGTNTPGELARLTSELASRKVNIVLSAIGFKDQAVAAFICNNEPVAETALKETGFAYETIPTLTVRLQDQPGQAYAIAQKLGDQGVNIGSFFVVEATSDSEIVAIGVDNLEAATKALGDQIVDYNYQ